MMQPQKTIVIDDDTESAAHLRSALHRSVILGISALLLVCAALWMTGCSSEETAPQDNFLVIDQGESGYGSIEVDMGISPAGKFSFDLLAADDALETYRAEKGEEVTVTDMLQAWVDAVTEVTVGDKELTQKPFSEWKSELVSPEDDVDKLLYYDFSVDEDSVTVTLPVALFDTFDENDISTKYFSAKAEDFEAVGGNVLFHKNEPTEFVVRVLDRAENLGGTVLEEHVLSDETLRSMSVQTGYNTSANCGMAGLRSYYSEGVFLTDILDATGVEFGPGQTLQLRLGGATTSSDSPEASAFNSSGSGTLTYEDLLGTTRYHYPAMWDDETTYEELGGATVYSILSENKDAWKGDDEASATLARIIGESKVEVSPIIAWENNVGVVAWDGVNPAEQHFGPYTLNPYTEYTRYVLHYGLKANEDGSVNDDFTVPNNATAIIGIDIYPTEITFN